MYRLGLHLRWSRQELTKPEMKNKLLILAAAIGVWLLAARNEVKLLAVSSGSMEPAIPVGSLIAVTAKDSYITGDIISFNEAGDRMITTHRISRIEEVDGDVRYFTEGDRNEDEDLSPVYSNKVVGKVVVTIPKLGGALLMINKSAEWVKEMISRAMLIDQEVSSGNNLAAGTMDLKITDDNEPAGDSLTMTWEGDNLRPGQGTVSGELKIKNVGSVAANHIHVSVENSITQGTGSGASGNDPMDANLEIKALQYNEVDIKSYIKDKNGNGTIDLDDWEKTPAENFSLELTDLNVNHTLSLSVGLSLGAGKANQGDTVKTTFSITGHQLDGE